MARRERQKNNPNRQSAFQFEWVNWTPAQLTELRAWLDGNEDSLGQSLQAACDSGWKISISENQRSGRLLVSLTDKAGRTGCAGRGWGIEHSDLTAAILGAVYYATEIIGNGIEEASGGNMDDLW